ncbi:hypothetical protein V5799_023454 [Amblyomma americanum]|uniref:Uncharacterized protein n=1 Tax=Amblyomma americanum TaxID=6943 RepID=A0AAQ4FHW6_AMBAM
MRKTSPLTAADSGVRPGLPAHGTASGGGSHVARTRHRLLFVPRGTGSHALALPHAVRYSSQTVSNLTFEFKLQTSMKATAAGTETTLYRIKRPASSQHIVDI